MTLDDVLRLTRRHLPLILAFSLLGLMISAAWTATRPVEYTATATGYVRAGSGKTVGDALSGSTLAERKAKAFVPIASTTPVAQRVIDELGLDVTSAALAGRISARTQEDATNLVIRARAGNPRDAQAIADAAMRAVADEANRVENDGQKGVVELVPFATATLPTRPSYPLPQRSLPLGLIAGTALGYLVAFQRNRDDTRIRNVEGLRAAADTGVLGVIPRSDELARARELVPRAARVEDFRTRESIRQLRTNLSFVDVDRMPRSIVVTSSRMSEGKSTLTAHLALALAQSGESVVLIDADLRRPTVHEIFGEDGTVGLTQVLNGSIELTDALLDTATEGLLILPAGRIPPNPSELLGSRRMAELIEFLTSKGRMVLLDAPPLLPVTDAALLAPRTDGAVLVVAAGQTRREHVEGAITNLAATDARLLGTVLTQASAKGLGRFLYAGEYGQPYELDAYEQKPVESRGSGRRPTVVSTSASLPAATATATPSDLEADPFDDPFVVTRASRRQGRGRSRRSAQGARRTVASRR